MWSEIIIGSRNRDKIREIKRIFDIPGIKLLEIQDIIDVEEDKETFYGNALKKAKTTALEMNRAVLADDSGLEVHALAGAPGVYSARYSGAEKDYDANNRKLLSELEDVPMERRGAQFRTSAVIYFPCGMALSAEGICRGTILTEKRGDHGFGYDPLFQVEGTERTMAEMSDEEKNSISHRGNALKALQLKLVAAMSLIIS